MSQVFHCYIIYPFHRFVFQPSEHPQRTVTLTTPQGEDLQILKQRCNGEEQCSIMSHKDYFDPSDIQGCSYTSRYLEVDYRCISKFIFNCLKHISDIWKKDKISLFAFLCYSLKLLRKVIASLFHCLTSKFLSFYLTFWTIHRSFFYFGKLMRTKSSNLFKNSFRRRKRRAEPSSTIGIVLYPR